MDNPLTHIVCSDPADFSQAEKDDFCALVTDGGEVNEAYVKAGVAAAQLLAFVRANDVLAGTACLKNPADSYRKKVFRKSGSPLDPNNFPFELGYVVVQKNYRGQKLSTRLVEELLKGVDTQVFATSHDHEDKFAMHAALRHNGFQQSGQPYPSDNDPDKNLLLFVRE